MATLAPNHGRDWSNEELIEISRLKKACQAISYYHLECSQTDEGDPWCSVCDDRDQSIVVHIARINRRYLIAFKSASAGIWTTTITHAMDTILRQVFGIVAKDRNPKRGMRYKGERAAGPGDKEAP